MNDHDSPSKFGVYNLHNRFPSSDFGFQRTNLPSTVSRNIGRLRRSLCHPKGQPIAGSPDSVLVRVPYTGSIHLAGPESDYETAEAALEAF